MIAILESVNSAPLECKFASRQAGSMNLTPNFIFFTQLASLPLNKTLVLTRSGRAYRGSGSRTACLYVITLDRLFVCNKTIYLSITSKIE
jgi:hypothetical protein